MVSLDTAEKNKEFAEAEESNFPLLADPTKETAVAYGVAGPNSFFAKRWTFFIDKEGVIRHIEKSVKIPKHGQYIADKLKELGYDLR